MPRVSRWFLAAGCIMAGILCIMPFSPRYALTLAWSFVQGETAIAGWIALGVPTAAAIAICIACSTTETLEWFYLADASEPFLRHIIRTHESADVSRKGILVAIARKVPYAALPLFGFFPFQMWIGIGVCKVLNLHPIGSRVLITFGNACKMVVWGIGIDRISRLLFSR